MDQGDQLLANLLPGLRDVRAPLSTGCIWLLTLWLILEDRVPTPQKAHGVWGSLYRLGDLIGPAGVLASGAFLAYLIGAMLAVRVVTVNAREAPKAARFRSGGTALAPRVSRLAYDDLVSFLQDQGRLARPVPEGTAAVNPERERGERLVVGLAVRDILGETRQLRTKLLIASYDLFNEYDRAVGEAEFRKNVAYALLGLTATLSWLQSPWWALLLVVSARLYVAGVGSERAANDVIVQAVVAGLITPLSITGAAGVPAVPTGRSQ
ncbi:hypothetical protein AQJ46_32740 [Streptomyces canus]|uniref:Uncharacterized protein n=1 Tax=Streptomyces canus TaxID=58343 RepID=A0A101RUQ1_9ACTN|nr:MULTISPECIES: hypothetical protein [Streptomyces]KUN62088.1 hypothetical protein AQJ46_32740 [Streptomyces canus]MDI5909029.1 hypothetical protein [Streptomyces sp. 12257]